MTDKRKKELLKMKSKEIIKAINENKLTFDDIDFLLEHGKVSEDVISFVIDREVIYSREVYSSKLNDTKKEYFKNLNEGNSLDLFAGAILTIWGGEKVVKSLAQREKGFLKNVFTSIQVRLESMKKSNARWKNYTYNRHNPYKVQQFIDKMNELSKMNPLYKRADYEEFLKSEKKFQKYILKMYDKNLETYKSLPFGERKLYLEKLVTKYEKYEKIIPYFNKDGTIRSYNTIATYNSMLYNVNLTNDAWNMTIFQGDEIGVEEYLVISHPFCCGNCAVHNGKVYNKKQLEEAVANGLKHPNCHCDIALYLDGMQVPKTDYDTTEWRNKYDLKQRLNSLTLKKDRLKTDYDIYKLLENHGLADETKQQINAVNRKIRQSKEAIEQETEFFKNFPEFNKKNYSEWIESLKNEGGF